MDKGKSSRSPNACEQGAEQRRGVQALMLFFDHLKFHKGKTSERK
jgi:hypothetical protein